jgi:hypothetical protein
MMDEWEKESLECHRRYLRVMVWYGIWYGMGRDSTRSIGSRV